MLSFRNSYNTNTRHGGLNQEKYPTPCLGSGPIFFQTTTHEVFKATLREIADFRPSETLDQTHVLGTSLLDKVHSLSIIEKKL